MLTPKFDDAKDDNDEDDANAKKNKNYDGKLRHEDSDKIVKLYLIFYQTTKTR